MQAGIKRVLMFWAFVMVFAVLVAATCWWFGREIKAIDQKIETIYK